MAQHNGEQLLLQGQTLREAGRTFEALDYLNKALDAFAKEDNNARFSHTLLDIAICWQHLYQFNGNQEGFAVLYKHHAAAMLEIVTKHNMASELADSYYLNGKADMMFKNYGPAIDFFQKAIEKVANPAQKGDWKTNLGKALYLSGKKEDGVATILQGIAEIKEHANTVDDYTAKVWESGAYMRLAETLKNDNATESEKYLKQAQAIISSDPRLTVRQKQLDNLKATGNSGL